MELRQLRYFVAVAEELNFRRAADVVRVAQPALSQQIKQLEEEIGVTLFLRNHHKVELTEAGKAFYLRAQKLLKQASEAITDARAVEQGEAGTLLIGFVSSAAISILPSLLSFIRRELPLAEAELREMSPGEQIDALYRHHLDIGFFHAHLDDAALETKIVTRERLMMALPAASPFALCEQIDLREIVQETIIIPARHATSGYFECVRAAFQMAHAMPERIYHTSLLQTGLLLVGAGLGVSLVPESFERVQVQGVVYRSLANDIPAIDLIAAWRQDNSSPLLARVTQHIKATAIH
jgi:DNA-binding transcriptional LysR family regulator